MDGYTDFIFINRFGNCQHQGTLNKALRRIIRDCNDLQLEKDGKNAVLLPNFSCHTTVSDEFMEREFDGFQVKMKHQDEEWRRRMMERKQDARENEIQVLDDKNNDTE